MYLVSGKVLALTFCYQRPRPSICTAIAGDFVQRGIAPLQRRPQPLWETRLKMGFLLSQKMWEEKMSFLIPGEPHHLPRGVSPLFDGPGDAIARASMPSCNAYGLLGTQFLDPLPVPKESGAHGSRSPAVAGPSFGDVSTKDHGPSDGEREKEGMPGEQTRHPAPAPTHEGKSVPTGRDGARGTPPLDRPASPGSQAV